MLSWLSALALAQYPSTPSEPLIAAAEPWPVRVGAYLLPPQDAAWLTDEAQLRACTIEVTVAVGSEPVLKPLDCPEPMPEAMLAATAHWAFEPIEGEPEGPTVLQIRYVVRYEAMLQVMTLHAEVDPGHDAAFAGEIGPPGVKLVHPAELLARKSARAPRGVEPEACRLRLTVDGNGKVARTEPVDCPEVLQPAAVKAASRWRYTPRIVDGMTMPDVVDVDVAFK